MKRARKLTSTLEATWNIPGPGLTQRQLSALKKAFETLLVASLAASEREGAQPLVKQRQSIRQFKVAKCFKSLKPKPAAKRRARGATGTTATRAKKR